MEAVATKFAGEVFNTGGGIYVVVIKIGPGLVVGVGDESICLYKGDPDREPYDIFWDSQGDCEILACLGDE